MALITTFSTSNTAGIDLAAVWSATANAAGSLGENVMPYPPVKEGTLVEMTNGSKAVYVKFGTGGVTGTGYVAVIPLGNYAGAVMMSNSVGNLGDKIGVFLGSVAALVNDYAWLQVYGTCAAVQTATASVSVALASTTTAGQLDDATGTGTKNLSGIFLTAAQTGASGLSTAELNFPVVGSTN